MKIFSKLYWSTACLLALTSTHAETIELHGSGATFPAPLYARWISEYNKRNSNVKVDYQAIGSGGGIKALLDRGVDFAGSDAPLDEERMKSAPGKLIHIPTVSGPVAVIYNVPELKSLTLNASVLADIYLGKITKWNDAKIAALNPASTLPDLDLVAVHRSDGSGTTWIFTNYLCKVSSEWKKKVGNGTSVNWPTGIGCRGGDGIGGCVTTTPGSIGFVELAYAENAKLASATLINKAGKPVRPTLEGVKEACLHSGSDIPEDLRITITDADGDSSYPICGFTYLLVYEDLSNLKSKDRATELIKFIDWCLHDGQQYASPGYVALSPILLEKVNATLKSVKYDSAKE